jgi:hypothetical protein
MPWAPYPWGRIKEQAILYVKRKMNIHKKYSMYIGLSIKTVSGRDTLNYHVSILFG